jgi:hypothetical protein
VPLYRYEMHGRAAHDQTWVVTGEVETRNAGEFLKAPQAALADAFVQLTNGNAIFGLPGVGCVGPYRIVKLTIEELHH